MSPPARRMGDGVKKMILVGALALTSAAPTWGATTTYECRFTDKRQCSAGEPCKPIPSKIFTRLSLDGSYARCDAKGCDDYKANVSRSGNWAIFDIPGRGMVSKMSVQRDIVEVTTINDVVLIGYGKCQPKG